MKELSEDEICPLCLHFFFILKKYLFDCGGFQFQKKICGLLLVVVCGLNCPVAPGSFNWNSGSGTHVPYIGKVGLAKHDISGNPPLWLE